MKYLNRLKFEMIYSNRDSESGLFCFSGIFLLKIRINSIQVYNFESKRRVSDTILTGACC